jgi:uncharacterized surface protein with fasciclin (FAS1) repeats
MRRSLIAGILLVMMAPFVFAGCNGDEEETSAPSPTPSPLPSGPDIVDTAQATGEFTTLLMAVGASGLEPTLRGPGPYTLFAPDDTAFGELRVGEVQEWLADPYGALVAVLQYHVVPGKIMSTDLKDGDMLTTAYGEKIKVTLDEDGVVMVNEAAVTTTDIEATNGIIHVIDKVLMPEKMPSPASSPMPTQ